MVESSSPKKEEAPKSAGSTTSLASPVAVPERANVNVNVSANVNVNVPARRTSHDRPANSKRKTNELGRLLSDLTEGYHPLHLHIRSLLFVK